ncbi:hypothetical protein D3C71_1893030 [compost metagenome]
MVPANIFSSVVLPQPFGPVTATRTGPVSVNVRGALSCGNGGTASCRWITRFPAAMAVAGSMSATVLSGSMRRAAC